MSRNRWTTRSVARSVIRVRLPDEEFGPRLPQGPQRAGPQCVFGADHEPAIRFELHRYGRTLGSILLCGPCFLALNPPDPAACDPLTLVA